MDAPLRHSQLLLDLIARPLPSTIPPTPDLIALQNHLEALRTSAHKRLRVLDTSRRRVEALRDRDIQADKDSSAASASKENDARLKAKEMARQEKQQREDEREQQRERELEKERRDVERAKDKERERERARRERDKIRREAEKEDTERERKEVDREKKEADRERKEAESSRHRTMGGKTKPPPPPPPPSSIAGSMGSKTAPPSQFYAPSPPVVVKTEPSALQFLAVGLLCCGPGRNAGVPRTNIACRLCPLYPSSTDAASTPTQLTSSSTSPCFDTPTVTSSTQPTPASPHPARYRSNPKPINPCRLFQTACCFFGARLSPTEHCTRLG